nr:50S ribosomal protein L4P [uncultured archaeon]
MKTAVFDIHGKKAKEIEVPAFFSQPVRGDLISRIIENKKRFQPYSPSLVAGKQTAASGKIVHRRHVWRSGYGRGMSRIPRKIMSRRGSQFNWVGAEIASTRGGRRAHPPKVVSMLNPMKVNKKESRLALLSALGATANKEQISRRYQRIDEKDLKELPIIVEDKITSLKTKEFLNALRNILGERLFSVAIGKKITRSGRGKRRGRRYKQNSGMLIVLGKKEDMKVNVADTRNAENLGITNLASGGLGRLTIYTERAIKDLEERFSKKGEDKK